MAETSERLLRQYLNLYWLRPETAIWRTLDAIELDRFDFRRPAVDLGCGDGTNAYILMGGDFGADFDAFLVTAATRSEEFLAGKRDIYDCSHPMLPMMSPPPGMFDVGVDRKRRELDKAEKLGVYGKTLEHDLNGRLPFEDGEFKTIFSNAIYWIERIDIVLAEMSRVLARDGKAILLVPNGNIKRYYIYDLYLKRGWDWCKNLDMGRYFHIRHCYSVKRWKAIFEKCGFRVARHRPYLSHRVIRISEVGLRPLSPVLIKMANRLPADERRAIKEEWIDYCYRLIRPLFDSGWIMDGRPTFHLFELTPEHEGGRTVGNAKNGGPRRA